MVSFACCDALSFLFGSSLAQKVSGRERAGGVFKLFGTDTGGRFAVVEHPLAPGTLGGPPHIHHNEDEASYVLEGEIMVQVGERLIQALAGTLIFKPKGLAHTFWNLGSAPARILEIISPAGFEKYFEELAELVTPGGPPDISRLLTLAQKYDLELDMSRVMELSQKYHVSLGGPGQPVWACRRLPFAGRPRERQNLRAASGLYVWFREREGHAGATREILPCQTPCV
jgi:quercetin dioxygenase-like cupin family protein